MALGHGIIKQKKEPYVLDAQSFLRQVKEIVVFLLNEAETLNCVNCLRLHTEKRAGNMPYEAKGETASARPIQCNWPVRKDLGRPYARLSESSA